MTLAILDLVLNRSELESIYILKFNNKIIKRLNSIIIYYTLTLKYSLIFTIYVSILFSYLLNKLIKKSKQNNNKIISYSLFNNFNLFLKFFNNKGEYEGGLESKHKRSQVLQGFENPLVMVYNT